MKKTNTERCEMELVERVKVVVLALNDNLFSLSWTKDTQALVAKWNTECDTV